MHISVDTMRSSINRGKDCQGPKTWDRASMNNFPPWIERRSMQLDEVEWASSQTFQARPHHIFDALRDLVHAWLLDTDVRKTSATERQQPCNYGLLGSLMCSHGQLSAWADRRLWSLHMHFVTSDVNQPAQIRTQARLAGRNNMQRFYL